MRSLLRVLAGLVALALFMSAVWAGCSTFLKDNEAYERGVETALADTTVQTLLGAPVEEGWFLNGTVETDGGGTRGTWSTRVRGTEASGTLDIAGVKQGGQWGVIALTLHTEDAAYVYVPGLGFQPANTDARPDFDILPE